MRTAAVAILVIALVFALATPALATGADGAGYEFGMHHAQHARDMGGFTGTENPGVMHQGFAGWPDWPH